MPMTPISRIDGLTTSIAVKAPCTCATTANITLAGIQTIDGVQLVGDETYPPDRVLVKDQTNPIENGIYNPQDGGRAWTRALDFDGARDITDGTLVWVRGGTTNEGLWKTLCDDRTVIVDTSEITFERVFDPNVTTSFPIDVFFGGNSGKPGAAEIYPMRNTLIAFRLPDDLVGSIFTVHPDTLPTATATFTLYRNAEVIGTIVFATNGDATVDFPIDVDFAITDQFIVVAPASQDATMNNVALNFLGQYL